MRLLLVNTLAEKGADRDFSFIIKQKLLPLGDDVTFIPGHGPMSTLGYERLHNPFLQDEMPVW